MKRAARPRRLESKAGLVVLANANGSIRRMECGDVVLNLFPANEIEGGPANIYLRVLDAEIACTPLLGPRSPLSVRLDDRGLRAAGEWHGVRVAVALVLAQSATAWFWHVALENRGDRDVAVDLIYAQDIALAPYGAIRMNEYYVSQYVDHTPLAHPIRGRALAVRQNLAVGGRQPWAVIGSLGRGSSFATDALQLHGLATRAGSSPAALGAASLPDARLQREHSMAVIQDESVRLAPGAKARRGFFGAYQPDHQAASSPTDVAAIGEALALPEAKPPRGRRTTLSPLPAATLFSANRLLRCADLNDAEIAQYWGRDLRHVERDGAQVLSFFVGRQSHVALRAKELRILRPHGHLMRSGDHLIPEEASLTSTAWMAGVFHSLVTQGHVSINRFLSTTRSYLGLLRSGGQRVFVEVAGGFHLLDVPSAFEMSPNGCRWIYKHGAGLIEVRSWASIDRHELNLSIEVPTGPPSRFLISHHVALNGDDGAEAVPVRWSGDGGAIEVRAIPDSDVGRRFPDGCFRIDADAATSLEHVGCDEMLFADGRSRQQPFLVLLAAPATRIGLRLTGQLIPTDGPASADRSEPADSRSSVESVSHRAAEQERESAFAAKMGGDVILEPPAGSPLSADVSRLQEILPWFAHNAMIHYLAPRGLEQYSGGGWGTRDVCQGPVELLSGLGQWAPWRDILVRVFRMQNGKGDWPQWFMFFDRERNIRPDDSHGDIIFWPLLALGKYLLAADDASILDEILPFFHAQGDAEAEKASVWDHVQRSLAMIARGLIPDTNLAVYGHGDWNDSLQPVQPSMRERLCSAWTVTLHYDAITTLAAGLRHVGRDTDAAPLERMASLILGDFRRLLIADGVLTGLAYFNEDNSIKYLLHPRDDDTGIHFRLLPMIHAIINRMLTPEEARDHVGYIREHLLAPDGARLFDRPPRYQGGLQRYFQRAETSTYFGREIGIMYMHAHLRYAESMARYGDAEAFFLALCHANPIGIGGLVSTAEPRQANCYYSSSDADFADRYAASERYGDIRALAVRLHGGWRIYSSGAGIATRLIHEHFLGLRRGASRLVVDPVIPKALDGLRAEVELAETRMSVVYRVSTAGCGPIALTLNGAPLAFDREPNPYRLGGAVVSAAELRERLVVGANELVVQLS